MIRLVRRFTADEGGATAIEYALIASLICVAIAAGAGVLGVALQEHFEFVTDEVQAATR